MSYAYVDTLINKGYLNLGNANASFLFSQKPIDQLTSCPDCGCIMSPNKIMCQSCEEGETDGY